MENSRGIGISAPGYQGLVAWQKAMDLVEAVYQVTRNWPRNEQYGLTSQVRRAAVSVPSNIAEGHGRSGAKEYAHHVSIAYGSLCELETQILIGERLGYSDANVTARLMTQIAEVRRITRGLLGRLRQSAPAPERQ
jgi:four helix bundle protein